MPEKYTRAAPADMRAALEITRTLTDAGLLFVPMPILNPEDAVELQRQAMARIEHIHNTNLAAENAPKDE